MNNERELIQAFEASQRRRNLIITAIVAVVLCGVAALKLYQSHLADEASKPVEIRTTVTVPAT